MMNVVKKNRSFGYWTGQKICIAIRTRANILNAKMIITELSTNWHIYCDPNRIFLRGEMGKKSSKDPKEL